MIRYYKMDFNNPRALSM